jgi:cyclic pyranopterin phosphate synthase
MAAVELATPRLRAGAGNVAAAGKIRPADPRLIDTHGRVATDLRVSLTDRCNLRCAYCMPADGLDWLPGGQLLSDQEITRLIAIAVRDLGVLEVRFTGGEPLLRRGLEDIVAAASTLRPRPRISLTTNGVGLDKRAARLARAGLDRVNVSLDTLRPERFATITRRDRLTDVLRGLEAARDAGLSPVKINSVLLRGLNDDEAVPLLRFALDGGFEQRFIEQMPLDAQHGWQRESMVTARDILGQLSAEFTLTPDPAERGAAPAERGVVDSGPGRVGIIGAVSRPFCGDCDRTRLTADGQVRSCLFATDESDLRTPLRDGADDGEIARRWRDAMWGKAAGHGIDDPGFSQPARPMSAIGG